MSTLVLLAVVTHVAVFMGASLGEQDAARFAIDALLWAKGDIRSAALSDYRFFVSPGYIWLARVLVPVSESTGLELGLLLNLLNLIAAGLVVLPLSRLFVALLEKSAAWGALLVVIFVPTFWQSGLYGFPHLLALVCMLVALVIADGAVPDDGTEVRRDLALVTCLTATLLLKADVYLTALAIPFFYFRCRPFSVASLARLAVLVGVPLALWFAALVLLVEDLPSLVTFAVNWNAQYAARPTRLVEFPAMTSWLLSFGLTTLPVAIIGVARHAVRLRPLTAAFVGAWLAGPLLFWSTRPFDSARHHFQSSVPAGLAVGMALEVLPGPWSRAGAAAVIVGANYVAFPPNDTTAYPSGNLLASARLIQARVAGYEAFARAFAASPARCKVVLGGNTNPYVDYSVLRTAERIAGVRRERRQGLDTIEYAMETRDGSRIATSVVVSAENVASVAAAYRAAGYDVASFEHVLAAGPEEARASDRPSTGVLDGGACTRTNVRNARTR